MLARLLRRLYLFQLSCGALLGAVLAVRWTQPVHGAVVMLTALLAAVLLPVLLQWLVIADTMLMSRGGSSSARTGASGMLWWHVCWREFRAALTIYMLRQPWTKQSPGVLAPDPQAIQPGSGGAVPVLLVHGYICNHRVWDDVARALRRAGHTVLALDLEPLFTSIDDYAPAIARAVTDLQRASGAKQVALVGHSMGGLAIRAWLRTEGAARVAKIVTLGSPHQGTQIAKSSLTPNGAQMVWHSAWLQALGRSETAAERGLMHLALTPQDNIVYPQRAQILTGASVTEFAGLGHLELCLAPTVIDWLLAQLAPAAPRETLIAGTAVSACRDALHRPGSLRELFWAFNALALQGFGGVVAVVQRELVDRRQWLTREQFVEDWAVAQVLPGPNVVNLSLMIGDRYFGWRGGLLALAGMLVFPLLIVLVLALLFTGVADQPQVQGALRGMGAVAAGMITATGLKLLPSLKQNVLGVAACYALSALTFVAIALLRLPLIWVLLGLGGLAGLVAFWLLGRGATTGDAA